ncbi:major facilitator superfamily domain-containing protein [Trichophaea hybrida]|nr:major facilitator superfamily domain-containing protein [Trichophaea hybrida]
MLRRPRYTLAILILVMFSEAMSSTLILPFIYFMVKDFGIKDSRDIGSYAGIITSSFWAAQSIFTTFWGIFSDKNGRKKVLLVGLAGNALFLPLFGTARSLPLALIARSLCGALNGNIGVARTSLGELAEQSDITHRRAFSLLGMGHAIGALVGPVIGGFLVKQRQQHYLGSTDGGVSPYLLPCLTAGIINVFLFLAGVVFLEETNLAAHGENTKDAAAEPLIPGKPPRGPSLRSSSMKPPLLCIATAGLLSLHAIAFDEIFPIFAATREPSNAGLSLKPKIIAILLSGMGFVILSTLLFGYTWLNKRISTLSLCRGTALILAIAYPFFPILPTLEKTPMMINLIVLLVVRFAANSICYTSLNILVNSCVEPKVRGTWNGIAQSVISLLRTVGPAGAGFLWSWGLKSGLEFPLNHYLVYLLMSVIAAGQFVVSFCIPAQSVRL